MKTIFLKSLQITNFKGTKQLSLDFSQNENYIYGANASGKTTIADAYRWLLTGKDSSDRKDFEVKPTDPTGTVIPKLENQVTATLSVNGLDYVLTRVNREKWVTRRGSSVEEFQGNETKFFVDEVPMSQKEFQQRVASLISDDQLKMMTDTSYFNSIMSWQDRRKVLTEMAGEITNEMVLERFAATYSKKEVGFITALLGTNKSFEERRKELGNKRKIAKQEKENIPSRIDEVERSKPITMPFERMRKDLGKLQEEVAKIDAQISDRTKAEEAKQAGVNAKRKHRFELESKMSDIRDKYQFHIKNATSGIDGQLSILKEQMSGILSQINSRQSHVDNLLSSIDKNKNSIVAAKELIQKQEALKSETIDRWKKINAEQISVDGSITCCPTCKQELPADQIEAKQNELLSNFNSSKTARLRSVEMEGASIKNAIANALQQIENLEKSTIDYQLAAEAITTEIAGLKDQGAALRREYDEASSALPADLPTLEQLLSLDENYKILKAEAEAITAEISEYKPADVSDLIAQKTELNQTIQRYTSDLAKEDQIKAANVRRLELEEMEKSIAQAIADYEAEDFAILQFIKAKMDYVQDQVNSLFEKVKYRMYRQQINGGEEPCCDCLVDGIEFEKNLNTADKVNAGIDVINALSKHYGISAPVFVDNRESVTELLPTQSQVINLVVSPDYSKPTNYSERQQPVQENLFS